MITDHFLIRNDFEGIGAFGSIGIVSLSSPHK